MKEYEHRQLVCEHECKVGEKYVLPQAQAFGLSWSWATIGPDDIRNHSWGRTVLRQLPLGDLPPVGEQPPLFSHTRLPPLQL